MSIIAKSIVAILITAFCTLLSAIENPTPQLELSLDRWQVAEHSVATSFVDFHASEPAWRPFENWTPPVLHLPRQKNRWFKADFRVGWHYKTTPLAISLGPLYSTAEVYVNGILISPSIQSEQDQFRRSQTQVFAIPSHRLWYSFLDFQKDNELLIHLKSDKEPLTIAPKEIMIDNYDFLALRAKDSDTILKIAQGAMIGLLMSFCLFSVFLRAVGFKERENVLFGVFVISVASAILSNSLLLAGQLGLTVTNSALPTILTSASVFTLVALYSERQQLSKFAKAMLLFNLLVISLLLIESKTEVNQNLRILTQLISISVLIEMGFQKMTDDLPLGLEHFGILIVIMGAVLQLFWALDYSPVKPLEMTLFIVAFGLLFNVALRFKHMAKSLLNLSNRLVSIREKERARLTRDIHDGVGQGLSTLKLLINLNAKKLEPELSNTLKSEVANTSNTLKSVIRNLKPIEVFSGSPTESIISLAKHNCDLASINLLIERQDSIKLSQEHAYQVYRIAQEALNNAIKHSDAKKITIRLKAHSHHFEVSIIDDGKGVMQASQQHDSYGMSSMQERSMIIGAKLSIHDHYDQGTIVSLEVPHND